MACVPGWLACLVCLWLEQLAGRLEGPAGAGAACGSPSWAWARLGWLGWARLARAGVACGPGSRSVGWRGLASGGLDGLKILFLNLSGPGIFKKSLLAV